MLVRPNDAAPSRRIQHMDSAVSSWLFKNWKKRKKRKLNFSQAQVYRYNIQKYKFSLPGPTRSLVSSFSFLFSCIYIYMRVKVSRPDFQPQYNITYLWQLSIDPFCKCFLLCPFMFIYNNKVNFSYINERIVDQQSDHWNTNWNILLSNLSNESMRKSVLIITAQTSSSMQYRTLNL